MINKGGPVGAIMRPGGGDLEETAREFLRYLRAKNRVQATLDSYAWAIIGFARTAPVDVAELRREHLEQYFDRLWASGKPASVLFHHKTLRAFFNWSVREGHLPSSPMRGIPEPRVKPEAIEPYTAEEIDALFEAAGHTGKPHRDRCIIALFVGTGIRLSELTRMRHEDVQDDRIRIRGKGSRQRWLGLNPKLGMLLRAHQAHDGRFPTVFGIQSRSAYHAVRRVARAAGIPNVHPHRFRDTFAVRFLENGGGLDDLQVLLGHTNISMTLRYVQWGREQRAIQGQMRYAPTV